MSEPPPFYDRFFMSIGVGLLITVFGAVLLFIVGIWFSRREPLVGERPPAAIKALSAVGFTIFLIGIVWQIVGYAQYVR